jgi:hypothetical protein
LDNRLQKSEKCRTLKLHFVHFFVKKVTKAIFEPSKFGDICQHIHSRPQISPKIARIANTLSNRVFDAFRIEYHPQKPPKRPQNRG